MELNFTTFILEIINFLALVWILKRLFFAPVKRVIEERKAAITKSLQEARTTSEDARKLKLQYEGRLREWETEKAKAHEELEHDLSTEREQRLASMEAFLESEREKVRVRDERRAAEAQARAEREAIHQSARFAARLLGSFASPELEARMIALALESLGKAPDAPVDSTESDVYTAFELSEAEKRSILDALRARAGRQIAARFSRDPSLLAGIEIRLGSAVFRANLRDELAMFSEATPA